MQCCRWLLEEIYKTQGVGRIIVDLYAPYCLWCAQGRFVKKEDEEVLRDLMSIQP